MDKIANFLSIYSSMIDIASNSRIFIYNWHHKTYIGNIMAINDYYSASDSVILKELGHRIRALRRRNKLTQIALAERTLLAVGTIKSLEAGKGKLSTLVAVLRELGALEQLDRLIPPITISPLKMADASTRLSRTARVRATAGKDKNK